MTVLYYSAQYRMGISDTPLDLSNEPEQEILPDILEVDDRLTYFLRIFDNQNHLPSWVTDNPFIDPDRVFPGALAELSFLNHVGITRIGPLRIRVKTEKLDEKTYQSLLDFVADRYADLIFSFATSTGENVHKDRPGSDLPYVEFFFLDRFLLGSPKRIDMITARILSDPHTILKWDVNISPPEAVDRIDSKAIQEILRSPQTLERLRPGVGVSRSTLARRLHAKTGDYLFPCFFRTERRKHSFDSHENRFVKFFLRRLAQKVQLLRNALVGKKFGHLNPEIDVKVNELYNSLATFLSASLWEEVGELTWVPANSQVLQKKDGYRELFQLYSLMQLVSKFRFETADFERIVETKDIPTLYEYWCFFVLKDVLDGMAHLTRAAPMVESDQLQEKLVIGLRIDYDNGTSLFYNLSYGHPSESYSHSMRPDFTLCKGGRTLVFDAKFKRPSTGKEGTPFDWEDINKMHAYRDALKNVSGAFILYPGDSDESFLFQAHSAVQRYEGVGALVLTPDHDGRPKTPEVDSLRDIISAFIYLS